MRWEFKGLPVNAREKTRGYIKKTAKEARGLKEEPGAVGRRKVIIMGLSSQINLAGAGSLRNGGKRRWRIGLEYSNRKWPI